MTLRLRVQDVTAGWTSVPAVDGVALDVPAGEVLALVGPNGSGKSTLLRTVYRALRPRAGRLLLGEDDLWSMPLRHTARRIGVLPQDDHAGFDFTAREIVAMGRAPHLGPLDRLGENDHAVIADALLRTHCADLSGRRMTTLSGGERQRVLLARALAQQPRLLILDEPTNHLDPRHQLEVLSLVRSIGATVVCALHSLDLAAGHADTVAVLDHGRLVAHGPVAETLTPERLATVFGVGASMIADPVTGTPRLLLRPLGGDG